MYVRRTLYILTTNTVSVFPAKFIENSLLLAYFSYLLIVGNSLRIIFKIVAHNLRIIGKKCAHNL